MVRSRPGHRLGFDHGLMLATALAALRDELVLGALPAGQSTLTNLQLECEVILGRDLDKSAFRRQIKEA